MFFVSLLLNRRRLDAAPVRHDEPARAALHGRDLRLLPARREPSLEAPAADADEAGACGSASGSCWPPRTRSTSTTRPLERGHVVPRAAADRARQARGCWTGSRARSGRRGFDRRAASKASPGLGKPRVPHERRARRRARRFPDALGDVVPAGPLSREQIRALTAGRGRAAPAPRPRPGRAGGTDRSAGGAAGAAAGGQRRRRPFCARGPRFLPSRRPAPAGAAIHYTPALFGRRRSASTGDVRARPRADVAFLAPLRTIRRRSTGQRRRRRAWRRRRRRPPGRGAARTTPRRAPRRSPSATPPGSASSSRG